MKLKTQKKLAGSVAKCSKKRVYLDPSRHEDLKEAITKQDIKDLIRDGAIIIKQKNGVSRVRAKKKHTQRAKGLQKGQGKRKGSPTSRKSRKDRWIRKIKTQRQFLKLLREKEIITKEGYRQLFAKAKGGFFRNVRHIKIYMNEHDLAKVKDNE